MKPSEDGRNKHKHWKHFFLILLTYSLLAAAETINLFNSRNNKNNIYKNKIKINRIMKNFSKIFKEFGVNFFFSNLFNFFSNMRIIYSSVFKEKK
jgi:hypothetical protein